MKEDNKIGKRVIINDKEWKISNKVFRYGKEWQYILLREKIDGSYQSIYLNEDALDGIIKMGSKIMDMNINNE
jgi:hypothetical protein|tara:strand:- start:1835 stop:2053 length:219 start_codon:yes stop_codon:yes gene_type:complete